MDATLLIADNDVRRRRELRRFFSESGFFVMAVANGVDCLAVLPALQPDVLVIAMEIPWGGGDGVVALLNDGLPLATKPLVLVIGETAAETLSARTGLARTQCFSSPLRMEGLLDRIGIEFAFRLLLRTEKTGGAWRNGADGEAWLRRASRDRHDRRERRSNPMPASRQVLDPS